MRIKLDENLPAELADILGGFGHDTDTTPSEGLTGATDEVVWAAVQSARRFFITQDLDFSDIRKFEAGTHHGLLLLRLREPTRRGLIERMRELFHDEDASSWDRCFLVASDRKLRVRRPSVP